MFLFHDMIRTTEVSTIILWNGTVLPGDITYEIDVLNMECSCKCRYDDDEYKTIKNRIKDLKTRSFFIANSQDMMILNRLLWECENVIGICYIDIDDPYVVEDEVTHSDAMLWDIQANLSKDNNPVFMSGWKNSYNKALFSDEEIKEYVLNVKSKLLHYMTPKTDALEIGVGTGLISSVLSSLCGQYDGCDISEIALHKLGELNKNKGISNMNYFVLPADKIDKIGKHYDVVLSSSVTEYFSGYNYMKKVLEKCVKICKDRGVIFVGDVFDLSLKETYEKDVQRYAEKYPNSNSSRSFSHELFFPYDYWYDMAQLIPGITGVQISAKMGTIMNEINRFRYDVLFHVDKRNATKHIHPILHKYQFGRACN